MENINDIITQLRIDYSQKQLLESEASTSPFVQFEKWFNEAIKTKVDEPHAMVLSTVNKENRPCSRIVLLREVSENGFGFFTNYQSDKGLQIANNNNVALNFFWPAIERQIRIEGEAIFQSQEKSDEYFKTRPEISRVGAWASPQSQILKNREELEQLFTNAQILLSSNTLVRPSNWGGYIVKPNYFEFWQGRPGRLHDRLAYKQENGIWKIKRLAP